MAKHFYENFAAALDKLIEFSKGFDGSEVLRAGIIQAFKCSFEQFWKAIQVSQNIMKVYLVPFQKILENMKK